MQCAHCSTEIPDGSAFCLACGADVSDPLTASTHPLDDAGVRSLERTLKRETAGEYEIEREIGRGGMGVVYLATETRLARKVAIKVLPPQLTYGDGAVERFEREARTAAALDHPNIIPIYRVSSGGELMWYSMKLLEGRSLETMLQEEETLSLDDTLRILAAVAAALDFAHARNVIHRDVKPANIMVAADGGVIVTDFGIAKELQAGSLTASGSVLGTPRYMSPEQYLGAELSGAADQYSLAVVAYQMLSGRVPFDANSAYELLNKHVSTPPPELQDLRPGLPPHVYLAVDRALAKAPQDRFASTGEFVAALRAPSAELSAVGGGGARRRQVVAGAIGSIALVGIVGIVGAVMMQDPDPEQVAAAPLVLALGDTATERVGQDTAETETQPPARGQAEAPSPPEPPPASVAAPSPREPAPVPASGMLIVSLSEWAHIYVDRALVRQGPVWRDSLSPGTHLVRLERDGYVTVDTSVVVVAGETVMLRLTMRARQ